MIESQSWESFAATFLRNLLPAIEKCRYRALSGVPRNLKGGERIISNSVQAHFFGRTNLKLIEKQEMF